MKYRKLSSENDISPSIGVFVAGLLAFFLYIYLGLMIVIGIYGLLCFFLSLGFLFNARHREKEIRMFKTIRKLQGIEEMSDPVDYWS